MDRSVTHARLIEAMSEMDIIDAHEHLGPEQDRLDIQVDALHLFGHYCRTDLICAGMSPDQYDGLFDTSIPIDKRWTTFRPFLPHIRHCGYARPAFEAARKFYGFDDVNDETYRPLSERMAAENTPGIYRRILRNECRIVTALTQCGRVVSEAGLLTPLLHMAYYAEVGSAEQIEQRAAERCATVERIDDYVALIRQGLQEWKADGVVGIKMMSTPAAEAVEDEKIATQAFARIRDGADPDPPDKSALYAYLMHETLDMCGELDLVVAVHMGMWGDFRTLDPQWMITVLPRHPETRFDLYHMGMPWVRVVGVIGKNNPNAWMNLCWTHIISPRMTVSALDEYIDLIPLNKIIGFGGDYSSRCVEKVYGHLLMARENIAAVLGKRIDRGAMGFDEAIEICRLWLYENPKQLYRLSV
ncbi:MAG: amidohydrolase family protein [Phycisphaerae bacterium]|nr:amidohydrolase family protein [Phycisphaerae bacterium]